MVEIIFPYFSVVKTNLCDAENAIYLVTDIFEMKPNPYDFYDLKLIHSDNPRSPLSVKDYCEEFIMNIDYKPRITLNEFLERKDISDAVDEYDFKMGHGLGDQLTQNHDILVAEGFHLMMMVSDPFQLDPAYCNKIIMNAASVAFRYQMIENTMFGFEILSNGLNFLKTYNLNVSPILYAYYNAKVNRFPNMIDSKLKKRYSINV